MDLDPVTYPVINLAGKDYEVKFRLGDLLRLKKDGIDLIDGLEKLELKNSESLVRSLTMLSHGLRHCVEFTSEQLADMFTLQDIPQITEVIQQALTKVPAQKTAAANASAVQ